ncbi:peptidase M41-like protein [Methylosinus sp. sav-2]|uniref:AAA family ATPase n=1 Tax=Methylosinus sp. sav-2 TaxID=2485168 RepID=UPI00068FF058|nr:AAA family ATPase [Methylosinus sp. sav-2]TDX62131.1 peptidase M41-like protein [Methylosinus sp. sav-2]
MSRKKLAAALRSTSIDDDGSYDAQSDRFGNLLDGRPSTADELAKACLDAALTPRLRKRIRRGDTFTLIIKAPGADWIAPLAGAARRLMTDAEIFTDDGGSKHSKRPQTAGADIAEALSEGRCAIGVSPEPERFLPATLLTVADAHLTVAPPDGAVLRRVFHILRGRRLRGPIPPGAADGLSFSEIVAAFRPDVGAVQLLENLACFAAAKARAGAAEDTPSLEELPGYDGPAREWALSLVADVAAWRAKKLPWRAIAASIVLSGPPGTGKTLLARAIARTLDVPIVSTSCGAWFTTRDGNLGDVIQAAQADFDAARAQRPTLLFIDELDGIPDRRNLSSRGRDWWQPIVNFLLTLLDGAATPREGIIVIGATNHPESLDPALIRPGRFDRIIPLEPPDAAVLGHVLRYHLGAALADVDLETVARLAPGSTPADAAGWAKAATSRARAAGRPLKIDDLVAVVAPEDDRSPEDLRIAAIHEAGHVVAHLASGREVTQVSLIARGESGGRTIAHAPTIAPRRRDIDDIALAMLAGRAAEQELFGEASAGAVGDLAQATRLLAEARARQGLGDSLLHRGEPIETLLASDRALRAAVERDLVRIYDRALDLIRERRDAVLVIADRLQERRCLTGAEAETALLRPNGP